jgi:hypothetical protein
MGEDDRRFRRYLTQVRAAGGAILVTGDTAPIARTTASQRLFGEPASPHARILVCLHGGCRPREYLPQAIESAPLTQAFATKTAARTETQAAVPPTDRPYQILPSGVQAVTPDKHPRARLRRSEPLAGLERAVLAAIDRACERLPADGQLRVGLTSLLQAVGHGGRPTVLTFCQSILDRVRTHDGVAHLHFPVPDVAVSEHPIAAQTALRAELRTTPAPGHSGVEWRWHLPAYVQSTPTPWLPV